MGNRSTQPKVPRAKPGKKSPPERSNKVTTAEFEREGLGVAPKE